MKLKRLLIIAAVLLSAGRILADEVTFVALAPEAVVQGNNFKISFQVNTTSKVKDFRAPQINDFSVLSGPSISSSSRTSIINGNRTSTNIIAYNFVLIGEKQGTFTIPAATVIVDGKQLTSNTLTIKVLPPDKKSDSKQVSGNDIFMLATVNKTSVYEQEAILLTYKVYVSPSLNLSNLSQKMPDLKNFHTQEVELPSQKEFKLEHYNERNYQTLLWMQYVLYPQQSGRLEIPATSFEGIISQPVKSDDMFDMFFNSGRYIDIKKTLTTSKIEIDVKPLPLGKSSAFYGGVGDFSISSDISTQEVKANEAVTVKVVLSGIGNLKLIKTPDMKFPSDFDVYDPKVDNKYVIKGGNQTGNKVFEYLAIPRHPGSYSIPAMDFQYFDTKSGQYKTIKTQEYTINVSKGVGSDASSSSVVGYTNKEDLRFVGEDVKFSKTGNRLISSDDLFFGSILFWFWIIVPIVFFIAMIVISRKQIADNANMTRIKVKKANSMASRRLKKAKKLMSDGRKAEFFDEILRALWGYVSDKLAIPVAKLSKDNVQDALRRRQLSDDTIAVFIKLLDDCEFAHYAPAEDNSRMDRLYDEAVGIINKIESSIK